MLHQHFIEKNKLSWTTGTDVDLCILDILLQRSFTIQRKPCINIDNISDDGNQKEKICLDLEGFG